MIRSAKKNWRRVVRSSFSGRHPRAPVKTAIIRASPRFIREPAPGVPVALNSHVLGRKSFMKYPGRITMEFLPAVKPGGDRETFLRI